MVPMSAATFPRTDTKTARRGDRLLLGLALLVLTLLPLWLLDMSVPRQGMSRSLLNAGERRLG